MDLFDYRFFISEDLLENTAVLSMLTTEWRSEAEDRHLLVQGPAEMKVFTNNDLLPHNGFVRLPPKMVLVRISGPIIDDYLNPHANCPDWAYLHVTCQRCRRKYQCNPFDDYYCTPEGDHACGPCLFKGKKVAHIDLEAPLEKPIFVQYPPSPS